MGFGAVAGLCAILTRLGAAPVTDPPAVQHEEDRATSSGRIVLVAPADGHWRAAVDAHLSGLPVELVEVHAPPASSPLARYDQGTALAQTHDALGVLWVEERDGAYLISVVRPEVRAIYSRRVDIEPDAPQAALEAVGLVSAASLSALLAGTALTMDPTIVPKAPEPEPEPSPDTKPVPESPPDEAPPPRERGRLVLGLGYAGTTFVREQPWQSGITGEAGWQWPFGMHVGAGFTFTQALEAPTGPATLRVQRRPAHLAIGFAYPWRDLWLQADALLIVDATTRTASADAESAGVRTAARRVRTRLAFAPRVRLGIVLGWRVEAFVSAAAEVWPSRVQYAVDVPGDEIVVATPRWVRFTTTAGIAVRL